MENLGITKADILALSPDIKFVGSSNIAFNPAGGEHKELRGRIVRQCDPEQFAVILRDVVLSEIDRFIFENATTDRVAVSMRIWPEARLTGKNDCYGDWYVRLSVYAYDGELSPA